RIQDGVLRVPLTDVLVWSSVRRFPLMRDHGKLLHLFLVRADDARAFAHLHPQLSADSATLSVAVPPLPEGAYNAYGDVVDETGFEHTVIGRVTVSNFNAPSKAVAQNDPDDAWFVGDATREKSTRLSDGSQM